MKKMKNTGAAQVEEMEEVRALYRKEALQRKLLYNQVSYSDTLSYISLLLQ